MGYIKEYNQSVQSFFEFCREGNVEKVNKWISQRSKKSKISFLRLKTSYAGWLCCLREPSTSYTPLHLASLYGHYEIVRLLMYQDHDLVFAKDKQGCLALHLAAWKNHVNIVQLLLVLEPSLVNVANIAKECSLHLASMQNNGAVVNMLLQHKANPHVRNACYETPLDIASKVGAANVCKILLQNCPTLPVQSAVECKTASFTKGFKISYPLHLAARYGNAQCILILWSYGFDINFVTNEGTPLHVAAIAGQTECIRVLIKLDAKLNICDNEGKTPLERLNILQKDKNTNLTQVMQNMQGWNECRKLIEKALKKNLIFNNVNENFNNSCYCENVSKKNFFWQNNSLLKNLNNYSCNLSKNNSVCLSSSLQSTSSLETENSIKFFTYDCFDFNNSKINNKNIDLNNKTVRPNFPKTSSHNCYKFFNPNIDNFFKNSTTQRTHFNEKISLQKNFNNQCNFCFCKNDNNADNLNSTFYDNISLTWNKNYAKDCCNQKSYTLNQQPATISVGTCKKSFDNNKKFKETFTLPIKSIESARPTFLNVFNISKTNLTDETKNNSNNNLTNFFEKKKNSDSTDSNLTKNYVILQNSSTSTSSNSSVQNFQKINDQDKKKNELSNKEVVQKFVKTNSNSCENLSAKNLIQKCDFKKENVKNDLTKSKNLEKSHSAEWEEIDEILSSIQRESFFVNKKNKKFNIKNTSLICLNENKSLPLTLNLSKPFLSTSMSLYANLTTISLKDWLFEKVEFTIETAEKLSNILEQNGFNNIKFLRDTLNEENLNEMNVNEIEQKKLLLYLKNNHKKIIQSIDKFEYLSDWLNSLGLIDYLGLFANVNLIFPSDILAACLTRKDLEKIGIVLLGHISKICKSLHLYTKKIDKKKNKTNCLMTTKKKDLLLHNYISFLSHYLGCLEILNIEDFKNCRRAINKLKKKINLKDTIPQVLFQISVNGISVFDALTNQLKAHHKIDQIQLVCQDDLDLNCFAYIIKNDKKYFCEVFCVLTANIAKEIILTLTKAFHLAFSTVNKQEQD